MRARLILISMLTSLLIAIFSVAGFAQQTGKIRGVVTDKSPKEPIPFVNVVVYQGDVQKKGTVTDFEGKYILSGLMPGRYSVKFQYVGYKTVQVDSIEVEPGASVKVNQKLKVETSEMEAVEVVIHKYPIIRDGGTSGGAISGEELKGTGSRSVCDVVNLTGGTVSSDDGMTPSVKGVRDGDPPVYINGVKVIGAGDIPKGEGVEEITHPTYRPQLTAGEINDFSKWDLWEDLTDDEFLTFSEEWNFFPSQRYLVQVKNDQGFAVANAVAELINGENEVVWRAQTDNTGKAELWNGFFDKDSEEVFLKLRVRKGPSGEVEQNAISFQQGINTVVLDVSCGAESEIDVAFVVDATGSMADEISFLKQELDYVIRKVKFNNEKLHLRTSSVFYRDQREEYVTRKSDFSDKLTKTTKFIENQHANGGGDYPEAVEAGLDVAVNQLNWNNKAVARIVFLVLDAPPHKTDENFELLQKTIRNAAKKGIRIIPVSSSGIDKDTEFFLRSVALATNGTYTFLTDDSGIGNPHIKPSTDQYKVELLTDLMIRLIGQYTTVEDCSSKVAPGQSENNDAIQEKMEQVVLYPNPTSERLYVTGLGKKKQFSKAMVLIFDLGGKLLFRTEMKHADDGIDLTGLSNGTYLLRLTSDQKDDVIHKKFQVRH